MKLILIIILFTSVLTTFGQPDITGRYHSSHEGRIHLMSDSTFRYEESFDLYFSWTLGKWEVNNDTILLKTILVYDTLRIYNENGNHIKDTLVVSIDDVSESIEKYSWKGCQNIGSPPNILVIKNQILYRLNLEGEIDEKKYTNGFNHTVYSYFKKE